MPKAILFPHLVPVAAALLILGCAPPGMHTVRVPLTAGLLDGRPAHVFLGRIDGMESPLFREELLDTLARTPGVMVHEEPPYAPPPRSCVLLGDFRIEQQESFTTRGTGVDEKHYRIVTTTTSLDYLVQDAATGQMLLEGTLRQEDQDEEELRPEAVKSLGRQFAEGAARFVVKTTFDILLGTKPLVDEQREAVLKALKRDLSRRRDTWKGTLCGDDGLPGLQPGIDAARANDWPAAAGHFQRTLEAHPEHPRLHMAHYDLGVAHAALERFDLALVHLALAGNLLRAKGHGLPPRQFQACQEQYETELERCRQLERVGRWRNGLSLARS